MPPMPSAARRLVLLVALAAVAAAVPARAEEVLRDAETEALFKDVARPLIVAAGLTPASVNIVLVADPEINAFAGGQNVYIYSGLIENADNVNWLQGVIAHELGHIAGGHTIRTGEAVGQATHISILSLIAAVGLAAVGAPEAGLAALGLGTATAEAGLLSYSRDQESSADLAGASYLAKAGLSGRGSIGFFTKLLGNEYRAGIPQKNSYGRTHPLDGERIAILEHVYQASPAWNTPPDPVLDARFQRVKAKLVGFIEEPPRTFQLYPEALTTEPARYAHAYAWHKSAYPDAALAQADALLALHPNDPYYLELKGQILFESGQPKAALPVLRAAVAAAPKQPLIATLLGHALIATDDPADAAEAKPLLRQAVIRDRENPEAWYDLGVVYEREGDTARAALATAERYDLDGDTRRAAMNAKIALGGLPPGTTDWLRADDIAQVEQNELARKKHR
jgi:predicted Zn-dependent protease